MFDRPPGNAGYLASGAQKEVYYACGWLVRPVGGEGKLTTWHNGSQSGMAAFLVRRFDGLGWALLFNTNEAPHGTFLPDLIDPSCHHAASKVKKWPEIDLFREEKGVGGSK